jgi:hypothetical protein
MLRVSFPLFKDNQYHMWLGYMYVCLKDFMCLTGSICKKIANMYYTFV